RRGRLRARRAPVAPGRGRRDEGGTGRDDPAPRAGAAARSPAHRCALRRHSALARCAPDARSPAVSTAPDPRTRLLAIGAITITSVLWGTTGTAATLIPDASPLAIGAAALGVGGLL